MPFYKGPLLHKHIPETHRLENEGGESSPVLPIKERTHRQGDVKGGPVVPSDKER